MSENIQWKRGSVYFTPSHLIGDLRIFTHKTSQRKNGVHVAQIKNGGMWVDRNSTSLLAVLEPLAWSCVPKQLFPTSSKHRLISSPVKQSGGKKL